MKKEYDFSNAIKNPYAKKIKKQITINIDNDTIDCCERILELILESPDIYSTTNSNEENWNELFQKLKKLKQDFWVKQENFSLYGVSGWDWNTQVAYYKTSIKEFSANYVEYIVLIFWYCNLSSADINFYKNWDFKETLFGIFKKEEVLMTEVCIEDLVKTMKKRAEYSLSRWKNDKSAYMDEDYDKFYQYWNSFQNDDSYSIWSIGSFEENESVAYLIFSLEEIQFIWMTDFL